VTGSAFGLDEPVLVLTPVRGPLDKAGTVPGATHTNASCGHLCWISPSGVSYQLDNPRMRTLCIPCMVREGTPTEIQATPGIRDDLRAMGYSEERINAILHQVREL